MPPNLIWNGGRLNIIDMPQITYNKVFNYYNNLSNFHLRHSCTNTLIKNDLIYDIDCNNFIKNYVSQKDYIIINSSELYHYLL